MLFRNLGRTLVAALLAFGLAGPTMASDLAVTGAEWDEVVLFDPGSNNMSTMPKAQFDAGAPYQVFQVMENGRLLIEIDGQGALVPKEDVATNEPVESVPVCEPLLAMLPGGATNAMNAGQGCR